MIKKILCILLAVATIGCLFAGCVKNSDKVDAGQSETVSADVSSSDKLQFFAKGKAIEFPISVGEFCELTDGKFLVSPEKIDDAKVLEAFHGYIAWSDADESKLFDADGYIDSYADVIEVDVVRPKTSDGSFDMSASFEDCIIVDIFSDYYTREDDIEYVNDWKCDDGVWSYDHVYNFEQFHTDIYRSVLGIGRYDSMNQLSALRVCDRLLGRNNLTSVFPDFDSDYVSDDDSNYIKTESISITEGDYQITLDIAYIPDDVDGDGFITSSDKTGETGSRVFVYDNDAINDGTADAILSGIHVHYSGNY